MKNIFIGCFNKSVLLTYIGMFFSIMGMTTLYYPQAVSDSNNLIYIAMICLIISGLCDLFDGVLARECERTQIQKDFGIQMDSFVDVVSFLILPLVILYKILGSKNIIIYLVVSIFYLICGITRLSWFNIHTDGHTEYYSGLPVTYVALILPILYRVFANASVLPLISVVSYILIGLFFILNIKIKKPRGIWYIVFPVIAFGLIILYMV